MTIQQTGVSPTINRHRLGAELRRLRGTSALRLEDVAGRLGVAPSTLSRIETGKAPARTSYVRTLLDLYGASDPDQLKELTDLAREGQRKGWWTRYDDTLLSAIGDYLGLETAAASVRAFATQTIPDLLQTEGYAAAASRALPGSDDEQACRMTAITMHRQELARDNRLRLHAIIDEIALVRPVGSAGIMVRQLERLAEDADRELVTIQVCDLTAAWPVICQPFTILSFTDPADPDIPGNNSVTGQPVMAARDADAAVLSRAFAELSRAAMTPASSAHRIRELTE